MGPRKKNKNNIWHVYSNIYLPRIIHVTLLSKFFLNLAWCEKAQEMFPLVHSTTASWENLMQK